MRSIAGVLIVAASLLAIAVVAQTPADRQKIEELRAKRDRGELLSAEDRAFIQRMMALGGQQGAAKQPDPRRAAQNEKWVKEHPPRESTGMIALTDLGKGAYKGEQGGLYPGGENVPPPTHLKAGLKMAAAVTPLDREGKPSPDGKIVLMSVGVSNTTMEFQTFRQLAAADTELNPRLVLVDGAQPGQAAEQAANPRSDYWSVANTCMDGAGVTNAQVQALWIKETYPLYDGQLPFPGEAKKLQAWLADILHTAQARFPNLKLAYLSSRIYAGHALSAANPEPFAYEFGFSNKWVIAGQIAGQPELNYDPAKGPVRAPWIAWGPYLWADGVKGRGDKLVWLREDFGQDGMHPSNAGREKVARLLLEFLKTDPTARPWFVAAAATDSRPNAVAQPGLDAATQSRPNAVAQSRPNAVAQPRPNAVAQPRPNSQAMEEVRGETDFLRRPAGQAALRTETKSNTIARRGNDG